MVTAAPDSSDASRLGFTYRVADDALRLALDERELFGWLHVERLELEVPGMSVDDPPDSDPETLQRRRTRVRIASLRVDQRDLDRFVASRAPSLAELGADELQLRCCDGYVSVAARIREGAHVAEVTARVHVIGKGLRLHLLVGQPRLYGYLPTPAPLVVHSLLAALLDADAGDEMPSDAPRIAGLGEIIVSPLQSLLWNTMPAAGWRLPATATVQLLSARVARGSLQLSYGPHSSDAEVTGSTSAGRSLAHTLERFRGPDDRLRMGDPEGALRAWRGELAAGGPEQPFVVDRLLAISSTRPGLFIDAVEVARQALGRWPDFEPAHAALASIDIARGSVQEAAQRYDTLSRIAAEDGDDDVTARAALAGARILRTVAPMDSTPLYERVLEHHPGHAEAAEALAERYAAEGRWHDSVRLIRSRITSTDSPTRRSRDHVRLAQLLLDRLDDPASARVELERACETDKDNVTAFEALATVLESADDLDDAIEALETAAELHRTRQDARGEARALARIAGVMERKGDLDRASAHFRRALELAADEPVALRGAAKIAEQQQNHAAAADYLQRLMEIGGHPPALYALFSCELGKNLAALGEVEAALPALERAANQGEPTVAAEARTRLATLHRGAGKDADAVRELASAVASLVLAARHDPENGDALRSRASELALERAQLLDEIGQPDGALLDYQRAYSLAAGSARETARRAARALIAAARARDDGDEQRRWIGAVLQTAPEATERVSLLLSRVRIAVAQQQQDRRHLGEALTDVEMVLALDPSEEDTAAALELKAHILAAEGDEVGRARALSQRAALPLEARAKIDAFIEASRAWLDADDPEAALSAARSATEAAAGLPSSAEHEDAERWFALARVMGDAAWQRRAWEDVASSYARLVESLDDDAERAVFGHRLATAQDKLDPEGPAAETLDGVLANDQAPSDVRAGAWRMLSDIYDRRGDATRAASALESLAGDEVAEITASSRADAWYRAGDLFRKRGALDDAERCLEAALVVVPDHMPALDALERLKRDASDHERVAVIIGRKIAATSRHPNRQKALLVRLATLQAQQLGRTDVARATFGRALELDPEFRPALRFVAEDAQAAGELARAADALSLLAQELPGDVDLPDDAGEIAAERIDAARDLADIARRDDVYLEAAAAAIDAVMPVAEDHTALLEAASDVHRARHNWPALAAVLGRRAALVGTPSDAAPLDVERVKVLWQRLADQPGAGAAVAAGLERNPDHAELGELRDAIAAGEEPPEDDDSEDAEPTNSDPVAASPESSLRAMADAAADQQDWDGVTQALEALVLTLAVNSEPRARKRLAEVLLELADLYYDRLEDPRRARDAMRRAADALESGARRDATLRILAAEAAAAGADADAAEALSAISRKRMTASDRLNLARCYQRLGRERLAIDTLESARAEDELTESGASLLFELLRESKRKTELADSLIAAAKGAPAGVAMTHLREAVEILDRSIGDHDAANRARAKLEGLEARAGVEADGTGASETELMEAGAEATKRGDTGLASDLLARAIELGARRVAEDGNGIDGRVASALDQLRSAARAGGHYEALVRGLMLASAVELDHARSCALLREVSAIKRAHLQDPDGAADALGRALAMEPGDEDLFRELESVLRETSDYSQLTSAYDLHLTALEGHARAKPLFALGCIHRDVFKQRDRAGELFVESHAADASFQPVWRPLAEYHDERGAFTLARPLYALALDWEQLDEVERERVAQRIQHLDEQLEEAAEEGAEVEEELLGEVGFEAVDLADAERAEKELRFGEQLRASGHPDAAISHFESAATASGDDERALAALEELYGEVGDYDALSELLGRMIARTDDRKRLSELWYRRARLYRDQLRRGAEAYRCLKEAHANDPDNADVAHALRAMAMARSEWALAAELLYREIAAAPSDEETGALHLELALIYDEKLLDAEEARINYEDALRYDPESPAAPRPLARLYELSGRHADAARLGEMAANRARNDSDRGQLLRRAAMSAERAGLEQDARRLYNLAAASADVQDSQAAHAALARLTPADDADAEAELLGRRLSDAASDEQRADILRQMLKTATTSGDEAAIHRYASALFEVDRSDLSAYLTLKARASDSHDLAALATLGNGRASAVSDPAESAALYYELGLLYQSKIGDLSAAVGAFEQALDADENHPGALEALAIIAYEKNDWTRARQLFERLQPETCSLPADLLAHRRGEIAEVLGREHEAMEAFAQAAKLNPSSRDALAALARTALRLRVYKTAIEASEALLELIEPGNVQALTNARLQIGEMCVVAGRRDRAVAYFEKVLSEAPKSLPALRALTGLYRSRNDHEAAAQTMETLVTLAQNPAHRAELLFQLGEVYRFDVGDAARASDAYLKAIDLEPTHVMTLWRLVDYYWSNADLAGLSEIAADLEAQNAFESPTDVFPTDLARVAVAVATVDAPVGPHAAKLAIRALGDDAAKAVARALGQAAASLDQPETLVMTSRRLDKWAPELDLTALREALEALGDDAPGARMIAAALA